MNVRIISDRLNRRIDQFEEFIREGMLPLWRGYGWQGEFGCHERLNHDTRKPVQNFHRLMNLSRQLYVFSTAYARWHNPVDARHAKQIFEVLKTKFKDQDHGGWYFSIGPDGAPLDRKKDLYGHAFLMFGLAKFARTFEVEEAIELARYTDDIVQTRLKLDGGWYAFEANENWDIQDKSLKQNPHMHLLEAYLALEKADTDPRWRSRVLSLAGIAFKNLMDSESSLIREYFDEAGNPCPEKGDQVEPGHQFEWTWLIGEVTKLTGPSGGLEEKREAMFAWAEEKGMDQEHKGIFNILNMSGEVIENSKRIWPIFEYLKAVSTHPTMPQIQKQERLAESLNLLLDHYLEEDGRWTEFLSQDLTPKSDYLPSSSMYHLMMAYEVVRSV